MDRRFFLKLMAMGFISHELDIDRLMWVPGEKKIFLPPVKGMNMADIIALELDRIAPKIASLFERDDYLYAVLRKQEKMIIEHSQPLRIPLKVNPDYKVH